MSVESSRTRTRSVALPLFVLTVVLVGLASCGEGDGNADGEPVALATVVGDSTAQKLAVQYQTAVAVAEEVGECMRAEGFTYVAYVEMGGVQDIREELEGLDDAEVASRFGYGISTFFDEASLSATSDPNVEYRASLSAADQSAYDIALFGFDLEQPPETIPRDPGGCLAASQTSTTDPRHVLQDRLMDMTAEIQADSRYQQLEAEWSSCMERAGHDALGWHWGRNTVQRRLGDVVASATARLPDGSTVPYLSVPAAGFRDDIEVEIDVQTLADVQSEELLIAAADWDCLQTVEPERSAIVDEYEARFEDTNQQLLAEIAGLMNE